MYTVVNHKAVGLVDGLAAVDYDASSKDNREQHFASTLLDKGIEFKCKDGEASVPADQKRISDAIGEEATLLDEQVHGVVAAAALKSVLVANDFERRRKYLEAVRAGHVRKLYLDLGETEVDTEEVVEQVLAALNGECMEELRLCSHTSLTALEKGALALGSRPLALESRR